MKTLKDIIIYPIKSIAGISPGNSSVEERGLVNDRRWMLIDEENRFLSQRELPGMSQFSIDIVKNEMQVWYNSEPEVKHALPLVSETGALLHAEIWGDVIKVVWPELAVDNWFSVMLDKKCKLVYMSNDAHRLVEPEMVNKPVQTSLSDGYPFLLANKASLDDLNERIGQQLEMKRFRPNLVIDGTGPYEEDHWKKIKIGKVKFQIIKPCARCVITTIDPETGERGKEPLQTLNTYRKQGNKLLFGQNMIALNEGVVSLGDRIDVLE